MLYVDVQQGFWSQEGTDLSRLIFQYSDTHITM